MKPVHPNFRLVSWNIRAGGGKRAVEIALALQALKADLVVLSEFRSSAPSQTIAGMLAETGLTSQCTTISEVNRKQNALLIASKTKLTRVPLRRKPEEPGRWLMVREAEYGISIGGMHIPNQHTGRKPAYHDAVVNLARRWRGGPALLVGDTNSGRILEDEERSVFNRRTHEWFDHLANAGWQDGFRGLYPGRREYTWYSHKNNGFRLDQIFVNSTLHAHLFDVRHIWPIHPETPERRDSLSDHAALIADFII